MNAVQQTPLKRQSTPKHRWTRGDLQHLRWYAERGLSQAETSKLMNRSQGAIAIKASELGISFHGPDGAPFANQNGVGTRFTENQRRSK